MALYTDADLLTIADLLAVDHEVQDVATAEKITLTDTLIRAGQEVGQRLISRIQSSGQTWSSSGDISYNHIAGVMGYTSAGNIPRAQLGQVVVTNPRPGYMSAVKLFGIYYALVMFYRDASNRATKQGDRYQGKRVDFREEMERSYWPMLQAQGLPIVYSPLFCPAAVHEPNTGAWAVSGTGSGSTATAGTYDVVVTWVGASYVSQTTKNNAESGPSAVQEVTLTSAQFAHVDITNLVPPTATPNNAVPASYSGYANAIPAVGWNVYAGQTTTPPAALKLINPAVLPLTTKTYNADPGAALGSTLGTGQWPDVQLPFTSTIMRG